MSLPLALDGTDDLLDVYRIYAGTSEVPAQYHLWCAISMIAAAVSNRVWLDKGRKLAPNLYVALVGPSALGKGEAIETMLALVREQRRINYYKGKITGPGLIDILAMPSKHGRVSWAHLYLVTPELSFSVGRGEWADALVKQMTEMYTGSPDAMLERTRTRGGMKVIDYCLNWIAGTTREWLVSCIPPDAISGGFFGRMVVVPGEYDFDTRYVRPIHDPDRDMIAAYLRARIARLAKLEGQFLLDPQAAEVETAWYLGRTPPTDPDLFAAWKRQHDLMLKLGMIFALASGRDDYTVTSDEIASAQKLSDRILNGMTDAVGTATLSPETKGVMIAAEFLRRAGGSPVLHSTLLKAMTGRGYGAETVRRCIDHLTQLGYVTRTWVGKGNYYAWINRKKVMPL